MPKRERGKEEELEARKNISGTPAAKEKASASPASSVFGRMPLQGKTDLQIASDMDLSLAFLNQ